MARDERSNNVQRWGPLAIVAFWLLVMGVLYAAMTHYLQPKPVLITASGDLVIPKAQDGHFYATGTVNGQPVQFLVDTGASLVTVSEPLARAANLGPGEPMLFKTANGDLPGRMVSGVPVSLGPIQVSSVRVGVGLVGGQIADALLGQSFLSQFEVVLSKEQMLLRRRPL